MHLLDRCLCLCIAAELYKANLLGLSKMVMEHCARLDCPKLLLKLRSNQLILQGLQQQMATALASTFVRKPFNEAKPTNIAAKGMIHYKGTLDQTFGLHKANVWHGGMAFAENITAREIC